MSIHIYNNITHCGITTTVGEMDNCISIFHTKRHAKGITHTLSNNASLVSGGVALQTQAFGLK